MIKNKKYINILVLSCAIVYFISYVSRINYSAVISEFMVAENVSKVDASLALTGLFITYGFGQLISGYLGDRLKPKYIIFFGLLLTTIMNILMPINANKYYMLAIWSVNGFAQAMMWPPIVKILTNYLDDKDYTNACVKVSWGSSFGTIAVYLLVPVFISVSGWKMIFYFASVMAFLGAFAWLFAISKTEKYAGEVSLIKNQGATENKSGTPKLSADILVVLGAIMVCIILQGILRDGVTTWMPSYISETYNVGRKIAILSGVIAPIFSIISFQIATWFYNKQKNELFCSSVMFIIGAVVAFVLFAASALNAVFSVAAMVIIIGLMHGINLMLVCFVPQRFKKYGNISTVSGVLNFSTYVGSALSTYIFALISEKFGWNTTIMSWFIVSTSGFIICVLINKNWKIFIKNYM